jgi:nucleoside diphosphate kinase
MITPEENFVREYAASLRSQEKRNLNSAGELLANYVERNMAPSGGRRHRFLLLIFHGKNPCRKLSDVCGAIFPENQHAEVEFLSGETLRDTYADLIFDTDNPEKVVYFEPAILTPRRQLLADENLALFSRYFKDSKNIVCNMPYPDPSKVEQTLVILKPDNWNFASSRPGTIMDMFSRTGLRIVGIKVFYFSLNQALDFYGPVEGFLKEKLSPMFEQKAKEVLEREFELPVEPGNELSATIGRQCAGEQFYKIVEFMSGRRPDTCPPGEKDKPGSVKCMIIVYEGEDAVKKIRDVLGPTDPLKAPGGTVRREFGSNIMVNTAHASDSTESYQREKKIVKVNQNTLISIVDEYLAKK